MNEQKLRDTRLNPLEILLILVVMLTMISCTATTSSAEVVATPVPLLPEDEKAIDFQSKQKASETEISEAVATAKAVAAIATPRPTQQPDLGIFQDGPPLEIFPPRTVYVESVWQDYVGDTLVKVFSGRIKADSRAVQWPEETEHGTIYIEVYGEQDPWGLLRQQFQTAEEDGALKIVSVDKSADNFVLHLEATNGSKYRFDSTQKALVKAE